MTRGQGLAVVAVTLVTMAWLLTGARAAASVGDAATARRRGDNDVALYQAIISRVRAGEGYYDAVGAELRARNYPVRPVFNWRQPTYAWLLGRLPGSWPARGLLALLGAAVVWLWRRWLLAARAPHVGVVTALVAVTMAGGLVANFVYLQESWAGFFIALSVGSFALDRWRLGVAAGLAALAFRELALLPCGVALVLAVKARRWPEVTAWLVGLTAYAALMSWHFVEVTRHTRLDDVARNWVALGGAAFLLRTCQWSPLLVALPAWAVALVLPFALLGLVGWRAPGAARAAAIVLGYVTVFAFVGHPFNDYWGAVYAPLLTLGFIAAPACLRDLGRALAGRTRGP